MPENETDFTLKFEGQLNEVDASTLGYSLVNVTSIIKEISGEVATTQRIEIKVKATAPGSFLIRLALQAINDPIFEAAMVGMASNGPTILRILTEIFKLRKVLKGEPPTNTIKDGDDVQITAGDNAKIVVDNRTFKLYFQHPTVNEALAKTFRALESDSSIAGFEISDADERPLFEATREDFSGLALTTSVPQVEERDSGEAVKVFVVRPSFDRKLKWDVLYKGIRITCSMKDEEFQNRIDAGERFGKGDVLGVELRIHQKLDRDLGAYVNKSYEILHVWEYTPRIEQAKLFEQLPRLLVTPGKRKFALGSDEESDESEKQPEPEPKPKLLN